MSIATTEPRAGLGRLWDRELNHYPRNSVRFTSLGIVVLTTIVLYYQFYVQSSVAVRIIADYHMSFLFLVSVNVLGNLLGAVGSYAAGLADRYGRANIITVGLFITSLLCLVGIPNAHSKWDYATVYVAIGVVEGVALVATPALIRDFSPQLGRASAMGFWTLGPVLGSVVVHAQVSQASQATPWEDHFIVAGVVGLAVAVIALVFLRELSPALRDQLMVTVRDRALIEARARGIDVKASTRHAYRQMFKPDIVGSAFAIAFFLIFYFIAVGFFPVFFQTVHGYSESQANAIATWLWSSYAVALVLTGFSSDLARVRKPFMLAGAALAATFTAVFAVKANQVGTDYHTFVVLVILIGLSFGLVYGPWMASFTETIERRNPALAATGLSVWGLILRTFVAVLVFTVPHVVSQVSGIVAEGQSLSTVTDGHSPDLSPAQNATVKAIADDPSIIGKVQAAATKYRADLTTATKLDVTAQTALTADPDNQQAQVIAVSEISGVSRADVTTIMKLSSAHADALKAAAAIDPATQAALLATPNDPTSTSKAVDEIVTALKVTRSQATSLLEQLANIPPEQLATVRAHGNAVQGAVTALTRLAAARKNDPLSFQLLTRYGQALQDPKVQSTLHHLQDSAASLGKAAEDSSSRWQIYWWLAAGGQILFIPLIFLMAGYWNPRTARRREAAHKQWLAAELAHPAPREHSA